MFDPAHVSARNRPRSWSGLGVALATVALAALAATPAAAEGERPRIFVGALGLYSLLTTAENDFSNSTVSSQVGRSLGGALAYGVQLSNGLSIDVDAEYVLGHEFEQETVLGTVSDDLWMLTFSSNVGYHPLDSFFDPFLSLGLGIMHAELDDFDAGGTGVAGRAAAGLNIWLGGHFGLRAEARYLHPFGGELEDLGSAAARAGVFFRY